MLSKPPKLPSDTSPESPDGLEIEWSQGAPRVAGTGKDAECSALGPIDPAGHLELIAHDFSGPPTVVSDQLGPSPRGTLLNVSSLLP